MSKEFRNAIITAAKEYGGSIRQLSRLTGLSYGLLKVLTGARLCRFVPSGQRVPMISRREK